MIKRKTWNEGVLAGVVQEKLPDYKLEQNQPSLIGVNYVEKHLLSWFAALVSCFYQSVTCFFRKRLPSQQHKRDNNHELKLA